MTLLWVVLGWLVILAFILRANHIWAERGKEADRIFHNYATRKKGRHQVKP